jgi:hypothetical protein
MRNWRYLCHPLLPKSVLSDMNYRAVFIFTLVLFCGNSRLASAQDTSPLLNNLSTEQKLQLLEYLRDWGADLDQQIIASFELLNAPGKKQAIKYLTAIQPQLNSQTTRTLTKWSRDTLYFGTIEEGTVYIDSVEVTNVGNRPYSITNFQTACDCTVLKAPTKPLLPGETAIVRVEFNSISKSGKIKTGIVLQDNSLPNARQIIYLKGEVTAPKTAKKRPWTVD